MFCSSRPCPLKGRAWGQEAWGHEEQKWVVFSKSEVRKGQGIDLGTGTAGSTGKTAAPESTEEAVLYSGLNEKSWHFIQRKHHTNGSISKLWFGGKIITSWCSTLQNLPTVVFNIVGKLLLFSSQDREISNSPELVKIPALQWLELVPASFRHHRTNATFSSPYVKDPGSSVSPGILIWHPCCPWILYHLQV